jgi:ABC-type lipoprotein release transport system permease subunit
MGIFFNLAWRNVWRNKRRSLISIASVLLAVVVALLMRSMQIGSYDHMIKNIASFHTGYLQIQAPEYFDKQSVNYSFLESVSLKRIINENEFTTVFAPRLESFALVSGGELTDVGMIIGIDPDLENNLSSLETRLVHGEYLKNSDHDIMLAEGLADHLKLTVGDTVVILGQGYHDIMAAGKYNVKGIIKFPMPELNNLIAYLPLLEAQYLLGAENRLTSIAVMIENQNYLNQTSEMLQEKLGRSYEVMTWEEMLPEVVQGIQTDNAGGIIMLAVLYVIIGFGILGTVLMMTLERIREFGMLLAVGMKRGYLRSVIIAESVFLSLIGAVSGVIVSIPILVYFYFNPIQLTGELAESISSWGYEPILPFSLAPTIFINQGLTVLILALIAAIYPVWKISRLEAVDAMRTG